MTVSGSPYSILFLCTGNSARSIISESVRSKLGAGRFRAFSAGSQPKGVVNPIALEMLRQHECPTENLRSKSWLEFASSEAQAMDFTINVCDNAAGETCPFWPGRPASAHWGIEDPAAVEGTETEQANAFEQALRAMHERIAALLELTLEYPSPDAIAVEIERIGQKYCSSVESTT